jgi:TnpA family transposase
MRLINILVTPRLKNITAKLIITGQEEETKQKLTEINAILKQQEKTFHEKIHC